MPDWAKSNPILAPEVGENAMDDELPSEIVIEDDIVDRSEVREIEDIIDMNHLRQSNTSGIKQN